MATIQSPLHVLPEPWNEKAGIVISELERASTPTSTDGETIDDNRYLAVSPYTDRAHLIDLDTLDKQDQLLTRALTRLECLRPDYATAPYLDTFNWGEVVDALRQLCRKDGLQWKEASVYIVAFRSQIPPTTIYAELGVLDKASHAEATASGGLLKYWFGTPDPEGRNLATCLWRNKNDAKIGGTGPAHRKASGATRALYSHWKIDRHRLIIRDNVQTWEIVDWQD